jgi:cystathionine gamma-synthase
MAHRVCASTKLFQFATSLGSVESLIDYRAQYDSSADPCLVRVSVGVEDVADLCWDMYRAIIRCARL